MESSFILKQSDSSAHNLSVLHSHWKASSLFPQALSPDLRCLRKSTRIHPRQVAKSQDKEKSWEPFSHGVYILMWEIDYKQVNK